MISQGGDLGIFVSGEVLTTTYRAPSKDCNPSTRVVDRRIRSSTGYMKHVSKQQTTQRPKAAGCAR